MADLSVLKLPNNSSYNLKDSVARTNETIDRTALTEMINTGEKNLLPFNNLDTIKLQNTGGTWSGSVYTHNGITFTINSDFTVNANGTATTGNNAVLVLTPLGGFTVEPGQWVLSGCPSGGSSTKYNISIAGTASDIGSSVQFTSCTSQLVRIYIIGGQTVSNIVFKPMICSKVDWDISHNYVPRAYVSENLLMWNHINVSTSAGINYIVNTNGTITVSGTTGSTQSYINLMLNGADVDVKQFCDGNHVLSGCPVGGSSTKYALYVAKGAYSRYDYGNGVVLTSSTETTINICIRISPNQTVSNLVFRPMIRKTEISDSTFVPYVPTNLELSDMINELKLCTGNFTAFVDTLPAGKHIVYCNSNASTNGTPEGWMVINVIKYASGATNAVFAIGKSVVNSAYLYTISRANSGWGSWYKYTGTAV